MADTESMQTRTHEVPKGTIMTVQDLHNRLGVIAARAQSDGNVRAYCVTRSEEEESSGVIVPAPFMARLTQLLTELEAETKHLYEIEITQFGLRTNKGKMIGSLSARPTLRVCVYNATPEVKALEGEYASIAALKDRISFLAAMEMYEEVEAAPDPWSSTGKTVYYGKCKKCHAYGRGIAFNSAQGLYPCCQNCGESAYSIYSCVRVQEMSGDIYTAGGGTLSVCETVANLRFVKAPLNPVESWRINVVESHDDIRA